MESANTFNYIKNIENFKKSIIVSLPKNKQELSWICEKTGKIMFKNDWEKVRPSQISKNIIFSKSGISIIKLINNDNIFPNNEDKSELINYLFSECLKILINN